ncbi:MAG: polysaccharide biosynthesis/export family protein [Pseudomonadota bacterium]|jgi:polysaccharide biosynthesis/export protein|nr:polysaccharide biosynthesis/export family protein [Pseudomonadota bacterium]
MKFRLLSLAALSAAILPISGCANSPEPIGGAPGLQVVPGDLPSPTRSDVFGPTLSYGIGPFDTLKISVFGIPELSDRTVRVDANGQFEFPLVGVINASGLQLTEISSLIERELRNQYVRDPDVTTTLEEAAPRSVVVYGQVTQPGVYPVNGVSSLLKSVAAARGLSEYGNSEDVVVFRTVNGEKFATLYNLKAIGRGLYSDPAIYPNDTIVVGESRSRRLFDQLVGAATLIATPITILLQQSL